MSPTDGKWVKFEQKGTETGTGPGARSSHAIAVLGEKIYAFGGEFVPRVPIDNQLYVFDLLDYTWSVASATGYVPSPGIGVTMAVVGATIYVFGGRDAATNQQNELCSFDVCSSKWTLLSSGKGGPPPRSYHSMTADHRRVYIFGGCGTEGRLNDLWAFDVVDQKWMQYPPPGVNCKGRGGPGLALAGGKIWVMYGFTGKEMDDIHCFDPDTSQWTQVETTGEKPTARSVFSTFGNGKHIYISGGEVVPSELQHLGAGKFSGKVYVLDTETLAWKWLNDTTGSGHVDHPGARAWCAFASGERNGEKGMVVYGGNSPSNHRLDDMFFFAPNLIEA